MASTSREVLRTKWENGCNIRIVYALMGRRVLGMLRNTTRGPVPIQQIVSDWDVDGVYDRYLHSKSMAVSGWYGNDRSTRIAWQGSENWSGLAKLSDEQGFQIRRRRRRGRLLRLGRLPVLQPAPAAAGGAAGPGTRGRGVDPYALIKEELGLPARRIGRLTAAARPAVGAGVSPLGFCPESGTGTGVSGYHLWDFCDQSDVQDDEGPSPCAVCFPPSPLFRARS